MTELGKQILEFKSLGLSYREIGQILQCSKGTIAYYCGQGQKEKNHNRQIQRRKQLKVKNENKTL